MRYCVIGIYSDRIAMEIRQMGAEGSIIIYEEAINLPLQSCFVGQMLNREGQELLLDAMEQLLSYGQKLLCEEIICFATSILRYASNRQDIIEKINKRLNLDVKVLTGAQQCVNAFKKVSASCGRSAGLGCQIGGGSTQIFLFSEGKLEHSASLPVGHGSLFCRHVSSVLPNRIEEENMRNEIKESFKACTFLETQPHRTIYFTGEACKKAVKLALSISGNLEKRESKNITSSEYKLIFEILRSTNLNGVALLTRLFPDSVTTIFPILIMMDTISNICNTTCVCSSTK